MAFVTATNRSTSWWLIGTNWDWYLYEANVDGHARGGLASGVTACVTAWLIAVLYRAGGTAIDFARLLCALWCVLYVLLPISNLQDAQGVMKGRGRVIGALVSVPHGGRFDRFNSRSHER